MTLAGFDDIRELPLRPIWGGIHARVVNGERLLLGVVELDPGAVAKEHHHEHEQLGIVIRGTVTFRIGDETRELGPGETWTIPSNVPHEATAGPEGAVLIDVLHPCARTGSRSSRRTRASPAGRSRQPELVRER